KRAEREHRHESHHEAGTAHRAPSGEVGGKIDSTPGSGRRQGVLRCLARRASGSATRSPLQRSMEVRRWSTPPAEGTAAWTAAGRRFSELANPETPAAVGSRAR